MSQRFTDQPDSEKFKSSSTQHKNLQKIIFNYEDKEERIELQQRNRIIIPNNEPTKCSVRENGIICAYAANTNQGIVRDYNEDRVSVILNILKPQTR